MNAQRAINFVNTHGSPTEKARLRFAWLGNPASDEEADQLFADQREDGGFAPVWASHYSSLDATCFRIAQAEQLGVSVTHPNLSRALQFLAQRQNPAGSWEEAGSVANVAPPWVMPGDKAAQLYVTANCGFWVTLMNGSAESSEMASSYLKLRINEDGEMPSYLQTHWLAGALWVKRNERDFSARIVRQLGERIGSMTASKLAWMIIAFGIAGLPGNHALMYSAAIRLNKLQDPTGPWRGDEATIAGNDVHVTIEALRALKMCNRI
jgi:hypothetical protein